MRRSARDALAHVAPVHDHVENAVLEQKLAALKTLGQRLAHRLLDDARTGEADERARLGEVQVPEHRKTRRHAARGRIGHDRDERQMRSGEARERGARLGHLQQRVQRLLHARAAACGEAHERLAMLDAVIDRALEALARRPSPSSRRETGIRTRRRPPAARRAARPARSARPSRRSPSAPARGGP